MKPEGTGRAQSKHAIMPAVPANPLESTGERSEGAPKRMVEMDQMPQPSARFWDQVATYLDADAVCELEALAHKLGLSIAEAARFAAHAAEDDLPLRAEPAF